MNEINVIENTNELLFKSNIKYVYKYNKELMFKNNVKYVYSN